MSWKKSDVSYQGFLICYGIGIVDSSVHFMQITRLRRWTDLAIEMEGSGYVTWRSSKWACLVPSEIRIHVAF